MKALLDNRFAPVTFRWGFIEGPLAEVSLAFIQWQDELKAKFFTRTEHKRFRSPLSKSLSALEPLTTPQDRYLLAQTRSGWSAIFSNGLRVNDVFSPVSHLPAVLRCRGLEIGCVPDRSDRAGKEELQIHGAVKFALYGPNKTDWLNRIRNVAIANDVGGWQFTAEGEVQPYELTENYGKRKITDRFTPKMLELYCAALGIDLFDPHFYGEQSCWYILKERAPAVPPCRSRRPDRMRISKLVATNFRDAAMSYAHQASTAKMGRDSMSVVDGQLKVYGVDNLRIADASIMPRVTTGNTMAPCVVIGERAGEILKVAHRMN